ncbi:MAG: glycosyltransferase family 2 protein [Desulfatitalea sp.]|nr:glycosyltransferase family 2 protein [Desulfatitalea sp.]NNK01109.1 glycosyltransferase family 2 protein [Desulfatitalea sp.]
MASKSLSRSEFTRFAVVIPVYNHGKTIRTVALAALELGLPVIVVDDGSDDQGCETLGSLDGVQVRHHAVNQGKGAALLTGFKAAAETADWAITLDADGQHLPAEAGALIKAMPAEARPIILGCRRRMLAAGAPWTSRFGRGFSNFWIRMAGGPRVTDSQSGFRIYPLPEVLALGVRAMRYQFEVEVLVKAGWYGLPVIEAPISVVYQSHGQRISHFRPFVDFMRNTSTFARLICQRLFGLKPTGHLQRHW